MVRRTRITIETDSLLVLRGRALLWAWCPQCGAQAQMIPLNEAGVVWNLPPVEVQGWLESLALHHTNTSDGTSFICLNSMLKRMRRTNVG